MPACSQECRPGCSLVTGRWTSTPARRPVVAHPLAQQPKQHSHCPVDVEQVSVDETTASVVKEVARLVLLTVLPVTALACTQAGDRCTPAVTVQSRHINAATALGCGARPTQGKRMGSRTSRWQAETANTCHWKLTITEYVVFAVSPDRGQLVVAGEGWTGEQLWEKQAPAGLVGQMVRLNDVQPERGVRVGGVTVALAAVWVIEGLFTATLGALQRGGREVEETCEGCNTIPRPLASVFWRRNMVLQLGASSSMWRPLGTCVVRAVPG